METIDQVVRNALDEISPPRVAARPWEAVITVRSPQARLWRRRPLLAMLGASAGLAAIILALVLAWPFGGQGNTNFLDRAAAAIGSGPVLHVTIESGFGATVVDLKTGTHSFVHGSEELWFDPTRGVRDLTSFRGVVQGDVTYKSGRVAYLDKTLSFLAIGYRQALRNGTARILGNATINGSPVTWIRIDTQMLPDTSDGKLHEWAHDVAVSNDTFKPVATRETRDGELSPDGISTIASIETLPSGSGDFTKPNPTQNEVSSFARTGSLSISQATKLLGQAPLTAGREVFGLKLSRIAKEVRRQGLDRATGQWKTTHEGITLYYGEPSGGGIGVPPPTGRYLQVAETKTPDLGFIRGVRGYFPPEGELLTFGGHYGLMQRDGIYVSIEASDEQLLVQGARRLAG
ncbi:MAG: hypothetical protein H0X39_02425 [Actinobacteria bacterium]|nr:hypothetical protein [Actinomycetota bacterium]